MRGGPLRGGDRSASGKIRKSGRLTSYHESRDSESASKDEGGLHIESEGSVKDTTGEAEGVALTMYSEEKRLLEDVLA